MYLLKQLTRLHWVLIMTKNKTNSSIETYAYGKNEKIIYKKEEIKSNKIIKQYKNDWLWWCYKRKYKRT